MDVEDIITTTVNVITTQTHATKHTEEMAVQLVPVPLAIAATMPPPRYLTSSGRAVRLPARFQDSIYAVFSTVESVVHSPRARTVRERQKI